MTCTLPLKYNQTQIPTSYHTQKTIFQKRLRFSTTKKLDAEAVYYYGARYLDPRTSRWLGVDPAMGEYVPSPGANSGDLPGTGGVYNTVNFHTYHYSFNNPVRYIDPDGRNGVESLPVANQLSYLMDYVETANAMSNENKADAANNLRERIHKFNIEGLMLGPDGNEKFMNEKLRDFLNTSDTGLPFTIDDMNNNGWSQHYGDFDHQNNHGNERNRKYTNTDGREAVFMRVNDEWVLSNDYLDKGTYNYASDGFTSNTRHGRLDMAPYYRQNNIIKSGFTSKNPRDDYNMNGRNNGTGHYERRYW